MAESAAGDLGQVADLGTFADPHHTLVIEWGVWPSWSVSSGLQAMAPIVAVTAAEYLEITRSASVVGAGAPASWRCTSSANASTSGQRLLPAAGRAGLRIEHVLDLDVQIQLARCLASSRPEQARLDLKSGAGSMVMR